MGKAEYGSPKYIAKQMKARGLQRLRWYCQVCEKQCRDENGFRCHTQAPSHEARLRERGSREHTEEYSRQFEVGFLRVLRLSHGTAAVDANRVYNEYIHDKTHVHMTATRWPSLAAFVRHLGAAGVCDVRTVARDGAPQFVIALVDRRAAEHRAHEEQRRDERAQAQEDAARAVLDAQLRAAEEDAREIAAAQAPACTAQNRVSSEPKMAAVSAATAHNNDSTSAACEARSPSDGPARGTAPPAPDAAAAAAPPKISFSLARKRKPGAR